ncbi:hypothetical protein Taro_053088 [Colocasia esculenta]|uniref:Pentatricopeptide repeat-containing protein n=1 Tax=Colocasia esculenta TaxID=4460 RepID=A0A843XLK0_COLES|nr:hypothetical protein [Colocasia esculenta]
MAIAAAATCRRLRRHFTHFSRLLSSSSSSSPLPQSSQNPASASAAKKKLRNEHDPEKSLSLLSSVSKPNTSAATSRYAVELVVKRLARSRRFSEIENLLETRKKEPMASQEPHIVSVITCYGYAGMIDHAVRTFDEMDELGTPRTVLSFNALLTAFNHTDNPGRVSDLLSELSQKYGIVPDKVSYGILIKSLCQSHSVEKAYAILKEMEDKDIEITPVTYTTLLDTLYKDEKVADAEKLWKEMDSKGVSPDVATYNVKIMYNAHHAKPESVISLIGDMVSAGIKPDTISYNYLITCYCKNGRFEDAKKVYKSLRERGCNPNAATYRNFMYFLCKNGDFDAGMEVCVEGIKKNKVPDFGPMKMLVEGLVKNYKLEEAKFLIKQVRKKFPESFMSRWKNVEEKLGLDDGEEDLSQAQAV